jgi:transketolase
MPCWELFDEQDESYRASVIPRDVPARLAVEAAASLGWSRYTGDRGDCLCLDRFGASAPGATALKNLGFNVENVVARARDLLK